MKVDASGAVQLQLDLFEYYVFWFSYYAVCKDNGFAQGLASGRPRSHSKPSQIRSLGHWVSGLHSPFHQGASASRHDLYLHLLNLYLRHFVQAAHATSRFHMGHTSSSTDISRGDFLLLTFVEFWLRNDDPGPLPASMHASLGPPQLGGFNVGHVPPGIELSDALRLVIHHANSLLKASLEDQSCVLNSEDLQSLNTGSSIHFEYSLHLRVLQRPLYRFIRHTFLFWPSGTPVRQARHVFDVWLDYLQPWNCQVEGKQGISKELNHSEDRKGTRLYSARWQGYLTINYPFYTSLTVRFLEFALKFIHTDPEALLEMTNKILSVLAGSKDLLEFLKKIDTTYHSSTSGRVYHWDGSSLDTDWEEGITLGANRMCNTSHSQALQEKKQLHLFGTNESGAFQAFQILILQSEAEIQFAPPETQKTMFKALEMIRIAGLKVFDAYPICSSLYLHPETQQISPDDNVSRALGRHTCFDVRYRGDWMRRPIESTEVAWLARLLVQLSDLINKKLNLDVHENNVDVHENKRKQEAKAAHEVRSHIALLPAEVTEFDLTQIFKTSRNPLVNLCFTDVVKAIKTFLCRCWLVFCAQLRKKGWRVNLRFLAKKPIVLFLLLLFFWILNKI